MTTLPTRFPRKGQPPVRWCLQTLTHAGWRHLLTNKFGGYRTYWLESPEHEEYALTTFGLRRVAMKCADEKNQKTA